MSHRGIHFGGIFSIKEAFLGTSIFMETSKQNQIDDLIVYGYFKLVSDASHTFRDWPFESTSTASFYKKMWSSGGLRQETRLLRPCLHHRAARRSGVHRLPGGGHLGRQGPQQFAHSHHQRPGLVTTRGMLLLPGHQEGGAMGAGGAEELELLWDWSFGMTENSTPPRNAANQAPRAANSVGSSEVGLLTQPTIHTTTYSSLFMSTTILGDYE